MHAADVSDDHIPRSGMCTYNEVGMSEKRKPGEPAVYCYTVPIESKNMKQAEMGSFATLRFVKLYLGQVSATHRFTI